MIKFVMCFVTVSTAAFAQVPDGTQRQRSALPFVIDQRNTALDNVALCQGDMTVMQGQMAALQKELDAAKAEVEKLTKKDSTK
jgi:hypothetical protein